MSGGNGLLRYHLKDELIVQKGLSAPFSLIFKGRVEGLDLVGEKLDEGVAKSLLLSLKGKGLSPVSLLGVQTHEARPFYLALLEGEELEANQLKALEAEGEETLLGHFHYKLARELNQLGHLRVKVFPEGTEYYINLKRREWSKGISKLIFDKGFKPQSQTS